MEITCAQALWHCGSRLITRPLGGWQMVGYRVDPMDRDDSCPSEDRAEQLEISSHCPDATYFKTYSLFISGNFPFNIFRLRWTANNWNHREQGCRWGQAPSKPIKSTSCEGSGEGLSENKDNGTYTWKCYSETHYCVCYLKKKTTHEKKNTFSKGYTLLITDAIN